MMDDENFPYRFPAIGPRRFAVDFSKPGMANGGAVAPTFTISALSAVANVVSMQIVASEEVAGFEVGDITVTGSLANFATADNIIFTVDWTLADDANTMDIAADVCQDLDGKGNEAAAQFAISYTTLTGAAIDTDVDSANTTADNGSSTTLTIGERNASVRTQRTLIKFDLSSIGDTILSTRLQLYAIVDVAGGDLDPVTVAVYRSKIAWTTLANWDTYDGINSWPGGAGGFGASDCEQTDIGSVVLTKSETMNEYKTITLTPTTKEALDLGNGWLLKTTAEFNDAYIYTSSDNASDKPLLRVVHLP